MHSSFIHSTRNIFSFTNPHIILGQLCDATVVITLLKKILYRSPGRLVLLDGINIFHVNLYLRELEH